MEYLDFKKLIDALTRKPKETEWLEFKHNFHSKEEIGKRISALSNSAYLSSMPFGYIVFGVDDESHDVVGTNLYGKQKMVGNEDFESWLSTRLNPRVDFEIIDDFDYEDKGHVCVFKIPATSNRPVSFLHQTIREQSFDKGYAIGFEEMVAWINSQLPANEEIGIALRKDARMYPEIAIRELAANMIIHQDFSEQGFPMIEIYSDRIEFSNPGQPLISVERFIDEYQSRNDSFADIMRRMGICEEKGSGMDKTIFHVELYQLPPIRFQLQESRTTATVFSYRKFADLDKSERVRACYQHTCLKYVSNEKMNNQSLRTRLGIEDRNYPMASRIIKDALEEKLIKEENAEGGSRHNYIPYWA